ncbi:ArsR/SmtB family transcription factor [Trichloromonas sp.]|uniref:ArsR/SmtB family transcription factor n=1 Tax=Trichloromonas sp. TaxID=3069249 RepID=UPI003D812D44
MKNTARLFKALSDETRLRILALLTEGELCVCDLMAVLELPQSTVSRHLAYLRNSGLVCDRRAGVWMYYRLAEADNPLQRETLALLARFLPDLPRVFSDRAALQIRLEKRGEELACG